MNTLYRAGASEAGNADSRLAAANMAWQALNRAHSTLASELATRLRAHHNLSLNAHAVLSQLVRAPDRKLRMTEIASRIDFSLSGLTGLVGRLEQDGLIERQPNLTDRRVIYARLTDAGARHATAADTRHQETLDAMLSERFNGDELAQLTELLRRITANGNA